MCKAGGLQTLTRARELAGASGVLGAHALRALVRASGVLPAHNQHRNMGWHLNEGARGSIA